jgi:hypothetical protein
MTCDDDDDCEDECERREECHEVNAGPLLIDLPTDGNLVTPAIADVPPGTYRELELKLRWPRNPDRLATFIAANAGWPSRASVRVTGTYDPGNGAGAQPFDVFFDASSKLDLDFSPPLEITDPPGPVNVTVTIDAANWFRSANGTPLDPRTVSANPFLLAHVIQNIRRSFHAFKDHDRDGHHD